MTFITFKHIYLFYSNIYFIGPYNYLGYSKYEVTS